ncbi:hypothetical protein ABFX02_08G035900 [Erythranthe guttata]
MQKFPFQASEGKSFPYDNHVLSPISLYFTVHVFRSISFMVGRRHRRERNLAKYGFLGASNFSVIFKIQIKSTYLINPNEFTKRNLMKYYFLIQKKMRKVKNMNRTHSS